MYTDIVDLRSFYLSPLGFVVRRLLRQKLLQLWPDLRGMNLLALGYATPLLRPYLTQGSGNVAAMMPATQGIVYWPKEGPNRTALAHMLDLPLADNSIDRVLLLHALEGAEDIDALLREVWRVMKSGGRMIAIIPNRRGLWAMSDSTPFGDGQPFSHSQVKTIFRDNSFLPERSARALYLPPWQGALWRKMGGLCETWGAALFPNLSGVLLVEASKQLYAPIAPLRARHREAAASVPAAARRPMPAPRQFTRV